MGDFDELRRGSYRVDGARKAQEQEARELGRTAFEADGARAAQQQEARELSRRHFRPDAVAKAAEQEAVERAAQRAFARQDRTPATAGDERGNTVLRRNQAAGGERGHTVRRDPQPRVTPSREAAPLPAAARSTQRDLADHTIIRRTPQHAASTSGGGGAVASRRSPLAMLLRRHARERRDDVRERVRREAAERVRERNDERRAARAADSAVAAAYASTGYDIEERSSRMSGPVRLLLVLVALVVAAYLVVCLPIDRSLAFSRDEAKGLGVAGIGGALSPHVPGTPYYVLALGSDAREGETASRSDTMILVRVDLWAGKLTMLSIPRDTKVELEGYGTQKINAAYAYGGAAGAVRAVKALTGAPVSQVAVVHFDGVENLVDYLGGVSVNVPVEVNDPDYTGLVLPAGTQQMDGHTALLYARVRHGFALGDYQRQKDQRVLFEAIMRKALALPPRELPGLARSAGSLLDTSLRMYSLLPLMARLKLGGATIYQATVPSTTAMEDGVSYVIADEAALAQMMKVIDSGGDPAPLM